MTPPLPFKVKTTVSWAGEEEGDLGFMENEIVEVYSIVDESWWSGKLRRNGAEGIFPKDYVKIYDDPYGSGVFNKSSTPSVPTTPIKDVPSPHANKLPYVRSPNASGIASYDAINDMRAQREFELERFQEVKQKLVNPHVQSSINATEGYTSGMKKSQSAKSFRYHQMASSTGDLDSRNMNSAQYYQSTNHEYQPAPHPHPHPHSHPHPHHYPQHQLYQSQHYHGKPAIPHSRTTNDLIDDDELIAKRKILEKELRQLKLIEKYRKSQYSIKNHKESQSGTNFGSDSTCSKRKEDLSQKFSSGGTENDNDLDDLEIRENLAPPPPPKHLNPVKPYEDEYNFKSSLKSLQSDVLNLSELSATSAGSFMRHKNERACLESVSRDPRDSIGPLENQIEEKVTDIVFQDKKNNSKPSIFKKLLKKHSNGDPASQQQQHLNEINSEENGLSWSTFKGDMNRMNSLTTQAKQLRTKRVVRSEGDLIVKPLEYVSEINTNETLGDMEIDEEEWEDAKRNATYRKVESFVSQYDISCDLNEFIADVAIKFKSPIHQIRAILLQLCKLRIIEENPGSQISQSKPKLREIAAKGEASVFQVNYLFKKMVDALRIPCELVLGFWKRPNEFYHNEQYVLNHCWLAILLDEQFFILDIILFKEGAICNIQNSPNGYNEHYFLARPLSLVSTHIPQVIDRQHVLPPIDQNIAFYLPRMYSGFFRYRLKFQNFNNALTRLVDLEHFECELQISPDVELFTLVKTSKLTTNELSLCQVKWEGRKRIAKIKAVLPENESVGVLQIFAGERGVQKHFENVHELAVVVPIYHSGSQRACKFVPRFPTVQAQKNDLYVKSPQNSQIIAKTGYQFEIEVHPVKGINSGSGIANRDFKLVIESPSGKYFKLQKPDDGKPYGTYAAHIKLSEIGHYRGLVIGDSGTSWYVFAQWESIANVIQN